MHELGIIKDLVKSIQDTVKDRGDDKRITKVFVRLGTAMGISEESFRFWFGNLTKDTNLDGALLEISSSDGREVVVDSLELE